MAKIGLSNLKYSKLTENSDGSVSYDGAKSFAKAIECKVSIENNSAELYADDGLAESNYTFKKGTVSLTVDEDSDTVFAELLGHTISEGYVATSDKTKQSSKEYYTKSGNEYTKFTGTSFAESTTYYEKVANAGEVIRKANDTAPFVGIGRVLTKMIDGVYKYKVEFLPKVKFAEPSQDEATQGESVEFKTNTIEGTVMKLADETWSRAKTFTSKSEAIAYLNSLMAAGK